MTKKRVGHVCKRKELSVLIVGEGDNGWEVEEEEENTSIIEPPMSVSLNSLVGIDNPKTMKMIRRIRGMQVIVMIDPEATHNFISPAIVEQLNLPVTMTEEFGVTLGTGETRMGKGSCQRITLELGAVSITENFLPLELGHSDEFWELSG